MSASVNGRSKFMVPLHQERLDAHWFFFFDSSVALLTERLNFPEELKKEESIEKMLQSQGCCFLDNIKPGIWIAGTMQTLDTRHIELFLEKGYQNGSWEYEVVRSHYVKKRADGITGSIFDVKHLQMGLLQQTSYFDMLDLAVVDPSALQRFSDRVVEGLALASVF
ncbi:hypothetical protein TSUD_43300 [Trifolium subterraneum]|uniref:Uncharacterized protein n=1 Tax=Trifolium subterraneum TaxID=3900 RepID=A0A2Z6P585_TRISU|nr:hypothetical protein TSUD_43300 [Trifolium subterraneum]